MAIRVVCPNGHVLRVNDALAGKIGRCPKCKARVQVPALRCDELSEDAILDILGPRAPDASSSGVLDERPKRTSSESSIIRNGPPKKICHRCNRTIDALHHICPHCHTYIAELQDFK